MNYSGSCHCGAVTFVVQAPESVEVEQCNCSICSKSGFLHLIVPSSQFQLLSGKDALTTYTFNTGVAQHYFCRHCGIKPFYIPRSNPDGVDVNVNCLDSRPAEIRIQAFDGQEWEANAGTLAYKSQG
jgi:hypothetical protein